MTTFYVVFSNIHDVVLSKKFKVCNPLFLPSFRIRGMCHQAMVYMSTCAKYFLIYGMITMYVIFPIFQKKFNILQGVSTFLFFAIIPHVRYVSTIHSVNVLLHSWTWRQTNIKKYVTNCI